MSERESGYDKTAAIIRSKILIQTVGANGQGVPLSQLIEHLRRKGFTDEGDIRDEQAASGFSILSTTTDNLTRVFVLKDELLKGKRIDADTLDGLNLGVMNGISDEFAPVIEEIYKAKNSSNHQEA